MTTSTVTTGSWFVKQMIKEIQNTTISYQIPYSFINTCLLANIYQFICSHLLAIVQFRTR